VISTNKTKETIASDDSSGNVKKLDQKKDVHKTTTKIIL